MSRRERFTTPADLVFCNVLGRPFDDSALRRRYRRAQTAAGVRPLRFHDLRHTSRNDEPQQLLDRSESRDFRRV